MISEGHPSSPKYTVRLMDPPLAVAAMVLAIKLLQWLSAIVETMEEKLVAVLLLKLKSPSFVRHPCIGKFLRANSDSLVWVRLHVRSLRTAQ